MQLTFSDVVKRNWKPFIVYKEEEEIGNINTTQFSKVKFE